MYKISLAVALFFSLLIFLSFSSAVFTKATLGSKLGNNIAKLTEKSEVKNDYKPFVKGIY